MLAISVAEESRHAALDNGPFSLQKIKKIIFYFFLFFLVAEESRHAAVDNNGPFSLPHIGLSITQQSSKHAGFMKLLG